MRLDERLNTLGPEAEKAVTMVIDELRSATINHDPFTSYHHGAAVIQEEYEELWQEIKKRKSERDRDAMRREAAQIAASAVRFMIDMANMDNGR